MAVEGINISLEQVSQVSSSIRTTNMALDARLGDIKTAMSNLAQSWQSPAAETIRSKFNGLLPTFETYKSIVESYAKFLDNTVTSYQSTETAINNNASSFK